MLCSASLVWSQSAKAATYCYAQPDLASRQEIMARFERGINSKEGSKFSFLQGGISVTAWAQNPDHSLLLLDTNSRSFRMQGAQDAHEITLHATLCSSAPQCNGFAAALGLANDYPPEALAEAYQRALANKPFHIYVDPTAGPFWRWGTWTAIALTRSTNPTQAANSTTFKSGNSVVTGNMHISLFRPDANHQYTENVNDKIQHQLVPELSAQMEVRFDSVECR
jgi:hypothetical protein